MMSAQENAQARRHLAIADLPRLAALFWYWKYRNKIHQWVRCGVTGILFLTVFGFAAEFAAHFWGKSVLRVPHHGVAGIAFDALVILFLVGLTWHHYKEARKPGYEYAFVKGLCDFTAQYQKAHNAGLGMRLGDALGVFRELFKRAKIDALAVFFEKDGQLRVVGNHVSPSMSEDKMAKYFPILPKGTGIGGSVHQDSVTRYMPWCSSPKNCWDFENWQVQRHWPCLKLKREPFTHTLTFDLSKNSEAEVETGVFMVWPTDEEIPYESLLCVPLASATKNYGFLQMTLSKANRLGTPDITMAVVIGLVLGQALDYLVVD